MGWPFQRHQKYSPPSHQSDSEPMLPASDETENSNKAFETAKGRPYIIRCSVLALLVIFMTTSVFFFLLYFLKRPSDHECAAQLSVWSPLMEAEGVVEYKETDFENDFAHQTKYRGPPTQELEDAWSDLWFYPGIRIPEEKMALLNRSGTERHFRPVEPELGGGYHALVEVFHQLHCLNLIRQFTWRDYYPKHPDIILMPSDLQDSEVGTRMHVDHCIEALRISLMCHGDTTPYLIELDPTQTNGLKADFSPHHKCRDFGNLVKYVQEHALD
ncbi:Cyclochlorotine biosynthesis protein [Lachnellula subtilissima]|uniref:Cyclochlorotine biosynthesis protein n=1 Tax=Lachnellula subtilissima TaxID=602034 RepID=A0A8H8RSQ3_9HELO|nr:Cyclochlorotine biosynthesis protein [Lachnellula subtilissima]